MRNSRTKVIFEAIIFLSAFVLFPMTTLVGAPPLIDPPTVTTNDATGIGETTATLNGYLDDNGSEICNVSFQYGRTTSYGGTTSNQSINTGQTFNATTLIDVDVPNGNLKDHYNTGTNTNFPYWIGSWGSQTWCATSNYRITGIRTLIKKASSPLGSVTFSIWHSVGSIPTTKIATSNTSYLISSLPSSNQWEWFNFSTPISCVQGSYYAIVSEVTGAIVADNGIFWNANTGNPYSGGAIAVSSNQASSWDGPYPEYDQDFEIYSYGYLQEGTLYHFRAKANNSNGTGYGSDKEFLTKPNPLTGFTATSYNETRIDINWTNHEGGDGAYVEYAVGSPPIPWGPGNGTKINVTGYVSGTSFQHTGLTLGLHYYKAWTFANDSGVLSNGSATKPFGDSPMICNVTLRAEYIPSTPSDFNAAAYNRTQINLTWTNAGTNNTYIEWNTAEHWAIGAGTLLYNGTNSLCAHTGLSIITTYYYQAWSYNVTDNVFSTTNVSANATPRNSTPVLSGESPTNGSTSQSRNPTLSITVFDIDNDKMNVTFWIKNDAENWVMVGYHDNSSNGAYTQTTNSFSSYSTLYHWSVNCTDNVTWTNETYSFTTGDQPSGPGPGPGPGPETEPEKKPNENKAPTADAGGPYSGHVNDNIIFDGSRSNDSDGIIVNYTWNFGDEVVDYKVNATHVYKSAAIYNVTLTVRDNNGSTANDSTIVNITKKSKAFLFDVLLELIPDSVYVGQNITALITMINVGESGMVNGTLNYTIYKGEEIVWSELENVTVLGQKVINKPISTKELGVGEYTCGIVYAYGDNITASAHASFTIDPIPQLTSPALLPPIVPILLAIAAVSTFVAFLFRFLKKRGSVSTKNK
jgi:hypothetical protein